ncbi:hypothetical protein V8F06_008676 [Rhypophila decipiens]
MDPIIAGHPVVQLPLQRKRRRPALSCYQCRCRKIKCDRNAPCRQCTKANLHACQYTCDNRVPLTTAPFSPHETQFSVFDKTPTGCIAVPRLLPDTFLTPESPGTPNTSDTWISENLQDGDKFWEELLASPVFGLQADQAAGFQGQSFSPENRDVASTSLVASRIASRGDASSPKASFYGQSHRKTSVYKSPELVAAIHAHETASGSEKDTTATFSSCKATSRVIKARNAMTIPIFGPLIDLIPTREVSDRLVGAYLRTFQPLLGILYLPKFQEDYDTFWFNPSSTSQEFQVILILLMTVGTALSDDCALGIQPITPLRWISALTDWLASRNIKSLLCMDGVRIHCLILLAHQTRAARWDTNLVSTGSLLQLTARIGLHIDPDRHLTPITTSPAEVEARRRLWATVLELELQASMADGTLLSRLGDDDACVLPLNIHDARLETATMNEPAVATDEATQSSMQILLIKTLPARLAILRFINGTRPENPYERVLQLSTALSSILEECTGVIESYRRSPGHASPTVFHINLFNLFVHRFFLALHYPFAVQARSSLSYYYSTKVCLDTSLMLCLSCSTSEHDGDSLGSDWHQLRLQGRGPFRDVYNQCAFFMSGELLAQLGTKGPSRFAVGPGSTLIHEETQKCLTSYLEYAKTRVETGVETSIKTYVLISCMMAQVNAMRSGNDIAKSISFALQESLHFCQFHLNQQLRKASELEEHYIGT